MYLTVFLCFLHAYLHEIILNNNNNNKDLDSSSIKSYVEPLFVFLFELLDGDEGEKIRAKNKEDDELMTFLSKRKRIV